MIALDIWVMDLYIWIRWSDTAAVSNKIYFVVVQNLVTFERLRDSGDSVSSNSFHRCNAESSKNYLFFRMKVYLPSWIYDNCIWMAFHHLDIERRQHHHHLQIHLHPRRQTKGVREMKNCEKQKQCFNFRFKIRWNYSIVSKFQGHPCRSFYVCKVIDQSHRV